MWAAAEGRGTLGIPAKVAREFIGKDMEPRDWRGLVGGLLKFFLEEAQEPEHATDADLNAAGVMVTDPNGAALYLRRTAKGDHRGEWCFPGGKAENGETPEACAHRELDEETGLHADRALLPLYRRNENGINFHTFAHAVAERFDPNLDDGEHDAFVWAKPDEVPEPLHPGVRALLDATVRRAAADERFALDRASVREYDQDGHLHVARSNISKAVVNPYLGREIPGYETLGLQPNKLYRLLRHPDELRRGAVTFDGKPLVIVHKAQTAADHDYEKVVGAVTDPVFEAPYLRASLVVWPGEAIDLIESGEQRELSCGYRYRPDMTPGVYEGQPYDGVMRDIVGNHVALVKEGRAGADVVVGDSKEKLNMSSKSVVLTRKAGVTLGALVGFLKPKLAKDAKIDWTPLLGGLTAKNFKERKPLIISGLETQLKGQLAKDASLDGLKLALDAMEEMDPEEGEDEEPETEEEKKARMEKRAKDKKTAMDEEETKEEKGARMEKRADDRKRAKDEEEEKEKEKKAEDARRKARDEDPHLKPDMVSKDEMNAAVAAGVKLATDGVLKTQREVREAERFVQPWVGQLNDVAFDGAAAVHRAALTVLNVDVKGVPDAALPHIIKAQPQPGARQRETAPLAMDAAAQADFAKRFPHAATIHNLG